MTARRFLAFSVAACELPPSLRDVASRLGIASTNGVAEHLRCLSRKGAVTWTPGRKRTLRVTAAGREALR